MGILDILSGIGQGIGGIAQAGVSLYAANQQAEQARQNYALQKETYDWEKQAQENTWKREDSAVQRRVADLKAAGLSPTLAAGSAAGTSAPIRLDTPQKNMDYIGAALGVNKGIGSILDSMGQVAQIGVTQAQKKLVENQAANQFAQGKLIEAQWRNEVFKGQTMAADYNYSYAMIKKVEEEANQIAIKNKIDSYNFDIAKKLGVRSDITGGFQGQLQQWLSSGLNMGSNDGLGKINPSAGKFGRINLPENYHPDSSDRR